MSAVLAVIEKAMHTGKLVKLERKSDGEEEELVSDGNEESDGEIVVV